MLKKIMTLVLCIVLVMGMFVPKSMAAGLAKMPIDMDEVSEEDRDKQILRTGIIAELDAVNLYEQLAASADNETVQKVLLDIADEEKTHIGEFQALLIMLDEGYGEELAEGEDEVKELMSE